MQKAISILGSTGSVGTQTLAVIKNNPAKFKVAAIVGNTNAALLSLQAKEFKPDFVGITCEQTYLKNKELFNGLKVEVGLNALKSAATLPNADIVVASVSGMSGFLGVYEAINAGKTVALANKESLVAGGKFLTELAKKTGSKIYPVDSEHSAIWQCLEGVNKDSLKRIILTASGGAFYGKTKKDFDSISVEQAIKNPNWNMGAKISVDSSTMMNKGLEIIEARWLFDCQNIDYIIHKESIIHSLVELKDGAMLAQMSNPSMLYPIQLALTYPDRINIPEVKRFDFSKPLTFNQPDEVNFPMPKLCRLALKLHDGAPLVVNAANEAAVKLFLNKTIGFGHIFNLVQKTVEKATYPKVDTANQIAQAHEYWYNYTLNNLDKA